MGKEGPQSNHGLPPFTETIILASFPKVTGFTGLSSMSTKGGALYVTANVTIGYAGAFFTNNASASIAFAAEM